MDPEVLKGQQIHDEVMKIIPITEQEDEPLNINQVIDALNQRHRDLVAILEEEHQRTNENELYLHRQAKADMNWQFIW